MAENRSSSYRIYVLVVLMLVNMLNAVDRLLPGILAERIKADLQLADWQIGAMTGFAFAIFLSLLGLPIARLADRRPRPTIIAGALGLWSGFTTLCGTAGSFGTLFLYRMGVGVGEAGCTPPAHSLITDMTPPEKRASALAFHTLGIPLGLMIGFALGGIIADAYGWRMAFFLAGAPGLVLALIAFLTIKETRPPQLETTVQHASLKDVLVVLRSKRTFWLVAIAGSLTSFTAYGQSAFIASFFLRNHADGLDSLGQLFGLQATGSLGIMIGILAGVGGGLGIMIGGWITDRVTQNDARSAMIAPAVAAVVQAPFLVTALSVDNATTAFLLLALPYILNSIYYGPVYAIAQSVVPKHMRSTASAVLIFMFTVIGLGLGPLTVGVLSDLFAANFGFDSGTSLRSALMVTTCVAVPGAIFYLFARRSIAADYEG